MWELSEDWGQADVTLVFRKGRSRELQAGQFNPWSREEAIDIICRKGISS